MTCWSCIFQKLDSSTRKAWNLKFSEDQAPPSYDDLNKFLEIRIRAIEDMKPPTPPSDKTSKIHGAQKISSLTASAKTSVKCALCKAKHYLHVCPKFVSKSPSQRIDLVKQSKRCLNCLSTNHAIQACTSKYSCRLCQKRYHTMLHVDSDLNTHDESVATAGKAEKPNYHTLKPIHSLYASSNTHTLIHGHMFYWRPRGFPLARRTVGGNTENVAKSLKSFPICIEIGTKGFSGSLITNLESRLRKTKWRIQYGRLLRLKVSRIA